jgi:UDP-glucose 4-epimerase
MKIVVLGGSGFLGSHLCDILSKKNHEVIIYDIKNSIWKNNKQKIIIGNILDENSLAKTIKGADFVFNFAGISDLDKSKDLLEETIHLNILAVAKILKICTKYRVSRYIHASTLYVNSSNGSFYKCSKKAAEDYIKEFSKLFKLNYTILRFGTIYGPRADISNGVYKIIKNAVKKNIVEYEGHKGSIREYVHVLDAVNQSVEALKKEYCNTTLMVSGHQAYSVTDFLKFISEILNIKKIKIKRPKFEGHYVVSPFQIEDDIVKKINMKEYIDLGEGILHLTKFIKNENKK